MRIRSRLDLVGVPRGLVLLLNVPSTRQVRSVELGLVEMELGR
jgi:hypothetical protein